MKGKRLSRIAWFSMLAITLLALLLPITIVFAEVPTDSGMVLDDAGYVLGDTYQRHSWYSDGLHWVFWADNDQILYSSSADLDTWATPAEFCEYTCNESPENCCNGSAFSLWYNTGLDRVDVAYMNITGQNEAVYYRRGRPEADGTIAWNNIHEAAPASANLTYSHPSICDNSVDYPFIAYMVYNGSAYSSNVSTSSTNNSIWTAATNSTISSSTSFNISTDVLYPSVIPVTAGNVSIQVAFKSGSDYFLSQNYADYDVDTDTWAYPLPAQFPLPASAVLDANKLWYHSEVAVNTSDNADDVLLVCRANDSILGGILFTDRYGASGSPWSDDDAIETDDYIATISIRDDADNATITAINVSHLAMIYSSDWTNALTAFGPLAAVDATNSQGQYIMSSYQQGELVDELNYLWLDNGVPFDLDLGCYGCAAPVTPAADPGTTVMQIIIPLLVAITVLLLGLRGIGEVNTINAIIILMVATIIGVITFFVVKTLVLGL